MSWYNPASWGRPGLSASAMVMTSDARADARRRQPEEWQDKALHYCDIVPEAWYASQFYARAFPKLELGVGEITGVGDDGKPEIEPTKDAKALAALDRIQDPGGGRQKLLSQYGRLQFVTGEGYLIGYAKDGEDEAWEFLSHKELRIKPGTTDAYQRLYSPGMRPEDYDAVEDDAWDIVPESAIVARLWRPHMAYSWLADSPMRAVLEVCDELQTLTQALHARATNRAAGAGILFIPNSIAQAIEAPAPTSAEESAQTPIMRVIYQGMVTPIGDPGHASAVVPIVLTGPDESGDRIRHITLFDTMQEWPEAALREKARDRFAMGADFPKEYLLGLSDTNHWNAWEIDDDTWAMHIQPVVEMFVGDLTSAILRPMIAADGVADPERFVVTYDESEVVTRPDKSTAAKDGWDRGIVSGAAYLREAGFDEETDGMDDDEYKRWVGIQVKDANLAIGGDVTPPPPPPIPPGQAEPPPEDQPQDRTPPPPPPNGQPNGGAPALPSQTARILGAAEVAILNAREKAGARLWSRTSKHPQYRDRLRNVPKSMIASELGEGTIDVPPPGVLVEGASEVFLQTLIGWGTSLETASYLAGAVHRHAATTLYQPDPVGLPFELVGYAEKV